MSIITQIGTFFKKKKTMANILNDKGFFLMLLGTVILTALVFAGKIQAEVLVGWLGGASGPIAGRMFARSEEPKKYKEKDNDSSPDAG